MTDSTDEMYVGMKHEGTDRSDAVIAWGDNYLNSNVFGGPPNGPDNLRFIFNELQNELGGNDSAEGRNGLEVARVTPPGFWGIGVNFYTRKIQPVRRLEVVDTLSPQFRLTNSQNANGNKGIHTDFETRATGDLYITPVNSSSGTPSYTSYKVVGIDYPKIGTTFNPDTALDVNGQTNLRTVLNQDTLTKVLVWDSTHNGNIKWRRANTFGGFGTCSNPSILTNDAELNLNNHTLFFYAPFGSPTGNMVAIGYNCSSTLVSPSATLDVLQNLGTIALRARAINTSSIVPVQEIGVYASASQMNPLPNTPVGTDIGVYGTVDGTLGTPGPISPHDAIAIYGDAESNLNIYAGYFNGDVMTTASQYYTSDSILKQNIQAFNGDSALKLIRVLKPKTYNYDTVDYPSMALPRGSQVGLIAQDVSRVIPALVKRSVHPAYADSTGVVVSDSVSYCGLNYTGLIPILVAGEKQLDSLQNIRPSYYSNALTADTTHMLQWRGSPLKHNTEIPMVDTTAGADSTYNIYFSGQNHTDVYGVDHGNIGIGYNTGDFIGAKLGVVDSATSVFYGDRNCGFFHMTGTTEGPPPSLIAISGISDVIGADQSAGGRFEAANGIVNYGVVAGASVTGITNYGGSFYASSGSSVNIGLYAGVTPVYGADNIALYGDIGSSGSTAPDYAGYFNGDVYTTGSYLPSDSKLKTNIQQLTGASALKTIDALQPKTYNYNTEQFPTMALSTDNQYGLISEDVEKVLPTLVKDSKTPPKIDSTGKIISPSIEFKALNYTGLVPILIAATKQLDSTNQAQQTKIDSLQAQLAQINTALQQLQNCCQQSFGSTQPGNREEVTLSNTNAIILDQNAPNPFAEQTTINYTIPESVGTAQLIFSDNNGQVIKTMQIQTRGAGSLLVYASNLSSGIYTYSLIADSKLIDTKKMTVQK